MKLAELRSLTALALSGTLRNSSPRLTNLYRQASADWLDDAFFQILRKLDVSGFLECGAHEASASVRFIHEGGETAVAAEANPATFNTMTTPARIHNVTCLNIGVGEEDGVLEFNVPRSNHVAGSASFMKKPGIAYSTENVPVHTIAHLHAEYFGPHQSIGLWVDVEGMALPVLKGAETLLRRGLCPVMKVEVETIQFWEGQELASSVDSFLASLDYHAFLCDIEYPHQYNVIYVHNRFLDTLDSIQQNALISLSALKLTYYQRLFTGRRLVDASRLKRFLLRSDNRRLSEFTHWVSAAMGSQSSREYRSRKTSSPKD